MITNMKPREEIIKRMEECNYDGYLNASKGMSEENRIIADILLDIRDLLSK